MQRTTMPCKESTLLHHGARGRHLILGEQILLEGVSCQVRRKFKVSHSELEGMDREIFSSKERFEEC